MNNDRGFTLVEILVSITILFIVGTVFFQVFIFSQRATVESEKKLVAIRQAELILEEVKEGKYSDYISAPGTFDKSVCISAANPADCESKFTKKVQNKSFQVKIIVAPENSVGLHPVEVEIYCGQTDELKGSVKGLMEL